MAGTYSTNLTTFLEGLSSETWSEPANNTGYNDMRAATTEGDTDDFIQGAECTSGQPGPANGAGVSALLGVGTALTVPTDGAILTWIKYDASVGLNANNGVRMCIGTGTSNFYAYYHFGQENYTYGGWKNLAQSNHDQLANVTLTNPVINEDEIPNGTPANENYTHVGWAAATTTTPGKGQGYKVDVIRYGRCDIEVTGGTNTAVDNTASGALSSSAANFAQIAEFNDYNGGGSATTGSGGATWTSVDTGFHRLGIFQAVTGGYIYKGLLNLGLTGTNVYFDAANENISIDDTRKITDQFNLIEIRGTGSTVNWETVQFVSNAIRSLGSITVVDNATVNFTGCSFTAMDSFIFQSNSTLVDTTFRRCNDVTQGGGTFTSCTFENPQSSAGLISTPSTINLATNSLFSTISATGNAVDLGTVTSSATVDWNGNELVSPSNRWTGVAGNGISTTANGAIKITATGGNTIVVDINVLNSATIPTVETDVTGITGGGSLTVNIINSVALTLTNILDGTEIVVLDSRDDVTPYDAPTVISRVENLTGGVDVGSTAVNGTAGGTTNANTFTFNANSGATLYIKAFNTGFIADTIVDSYTTSQNIQISQRADRVFSNP